MHAISGGSARACPVADAFSMIVGRNQARVTSQSARRRSQSTHYQHISDIIRASARVVATADETASAVRACVVFGACNPVVIVLLPPSSPLTRANERQINGPNCAMSTSSGWRRRWTRRCCTDTHFVTSVIIIVSADYKIAALDARPRRVQ